MTGENDILRVPLCGPAASLEAPASLLPAIAELERVFGEAILWFEPQELPLPVITIQSKGRKAALGWFGAERWEDRSHGRHPEINISAEYLDRDVENIAETLIHEMVHYANALDKIRDCSSNQYHNKHFKERAEAIGLRCQRTSRGWSETSLGPDLRAWVEGLQIRPEPFAMFRRSPARRARSSVNADGNPKQRRWACQCGPIRVGRSTFRARCLDCGQMFALDPDLSFEEARG